MAPDSNFNPVSFVIPAHNEEKYIVKTIKAIQNANEDLGTLFEVVVVNDNSNDRTAELANSLGATVVDVDLRNIGAVRNAGAKAVTHDWLIFVDADTSIQTNTLRQTLEALSAGCVGGGARVDLIDEGPISWFKYGMFRAVRLIWQTGGNWAAGCYMFCLREKFNEFGGFDETYFAAEELFFSRQLKRLGKFVIVSEPVLTSPRKLHNYTVVELLRFLTRPMLAGRKALRSRTGLEVLYEDDRR